MKQHREVKICRWDDLGKGPWDHAVGSDRLAIILLSLIEQLGFEVVYVYENHMLEKIKVQPSNPVKYMKAKKK